MLVTFLLFLIPIVSAEESYIYKQNQIIDFKISCFDENRSYCNNLTTCKITILYPNSTVLINNQDMDHNPSFFNYTITNTYTLGEYSGVVQCSGTTNGYTTITYLITESGNEVQENTLFPIIIVGVILIVFFISLTFVFNHAGVRLFGFVAAIMEMTFLTFVIFAKETGAPLISLLKANFWLILILTFGMTIIGLVAYFVKTINLREDMEELDEPKWGKR